MKGRPALPGVFALLVHDSPGCGFQEVAMAVDLHDRVAVVTGAGNGLGAEYARTLARLGAAPGHLRGLRFSSPRHGLSGPMFQERQHDFTTAARSRHEQIVK
jgi:hypothetical protein